jgi:hypothetical protein
MHVPFWIAFRTSTNQPKSVTERSNAYPAYISAFYFQMASPRHVVWGVYTKCLLSQTIFANFGTQPLNDIVIYRQLIFFLKPYLTTHLLSLLPDVERLWVTATAV